MARAKTSKLFDSRPDLVAHLVDASLAHRLTEGSAAKVWWRCEMGHEWEAQIRHRANGSGCPYCSGRLAIAGENDLATTRPDLAAQLVDSSLATSLKENSNTSASWKCESGHEWEAIVANRAKGNGCPYCSGRMATSGQSDLLTMRPDLAAELTEPSLATELMPGSGSKVSWTCKQGHQWEARVYQRAGGSGCPYCADRVLIPGLNDLATTHPQIASELVDPNQATRLREHASDKVAWRCALGHEWEASVHHRTSGTGCPYCYGLLVAPGENDLATVYPHLVKELADPSLAPTLYAGGNKRVEWKCEEGHTWVTTISHRIGGNDCPTCAESGFKRDMPAVVYCVANHQWLKVGISNTHSLDSRIRKHARQGLTEVLAVRHFDMGSQAYTVEREWMKALEHAPDDLRPTKMDIHDGHTEAVRRTAAYESVALSLLSASAR